MEVPLVWTDIHTCVLNPPVGDDAIGRPWVVRAGGLYRIWLSMRSFSQALPYRVRYAESHDGFLWTQKDPGIGVSPSGWDSEMICFPAVVDCGWRRLMFYNGNRHGETGFGLAQLEAD